jgi:RimJ/RimL family protein N-acetyltransferase
VSNEAGASVRTTWARLPEACRYQAWGPNTADQTRAFVQAAADGWRRDPPVRFAFAVVTGGTVVGTADLKLRGDRQGEIGYAVHPACWGRGLATQAARRLLDRGFQEHGLHRIAATCDPRNAASARVITKLGMIHEGRLRQTVFIRDGWRDSDVYSLLAHEWHG